MSQYRLTAKGKRTITSLFLMVASGTVLAIYYRMGLIYAMIGIFTASAIGFLFELYLGIKTLMRRNSLKDRMQQTLHVDHSKEAILEAMDEMELERVSPDPIAAEPEPVATEPEAPALPLAYEEMPYESKREEQPPEEHHIKDDEIEQKSMYDVEDVILVSPYSLPQGNEEAVEVELKEEPVAPKKEVPVFRPFGNQLDAVVEGSDELLVSKTVEEEAEPVENKEHYRKLSELVRKLQRPKFGWLHDLQLEGEQGAMNYLDYLFMTDKGLFVLHEMEDYAVLSGNAEAGQWSCYKTQDDYHGHRPSVVDNPVKSLNAAVEAIKQILFEFDLLLPVHGFYITQDQCDLHVSDNGAEKAVELNRLLETIDSKHGIPDISDEMIDILREIFVIKDEIARESAQG